MAVGAVILGLDLLEYWQIGRGNMVRRPFGMLGFEIFGLQTVFFGLLWLAPVTMTSRERQIAERLQTLLDIGRSRPRE